MSKCCFGRVRSLKKVQPSPTVVVTIAVARTCACAFPKVKDHAGSSLARYVGKALAAAGMEAEERAGGSDGDGLGNRSLLVLYGTEGGHSQEIAQEIGQAAERLRFQTDIEEMNDVPLVSPT